MWIDAELRNIVIDERHDRQTVYLHEINGERVLDIGIGPMEAMAISRALQGTPFSRPLTHDLIHNLMTSCGYKLSEIRIREKIEDTYFADLVMQNENGEEMILDSRPSDALALLAKQDKRILRIEEDLF